MKKLLVLVMCAAFALAACGDDNGGGGANIPGAVSSLNATAQATVQTQCQCYATDLGYSSESECVNELYEPENLTQCQEQAASCDPSNFTAVMGCRESALRDYQTCISQCPDQATRENCTTELNNAQSACSGQLSDTLAQAFASCQQGQVPECYFGNNNGGTNNGGTNNGGTNNGGTNNGGTNNGGTNNGGTCGEGEVYTAPPGLPQACYALCESSVECSTGEICDTFSTGTETIGLCVPDDGGTNNGGTNNGGTNNGNSCGEGEVLVQPPNLPEGCYALCQSSADCFTDEICQTYSAGTESISLCVPDSGGTNNGGTNNGTGTDPNNPRIDAAISVVDSASGDLTVAFCDCYSSQFDSYQACLSEVGGGDSSYTICQREAISCDISAFEDLMQCLATALQSYEGCVAMCPSDQTSLDACGQDYEADAQSCEQRYVTQELAQGFQACADGQQVYCGQ